MSILPARCIVLGTCLIIVQFWLMRDSLMVTMVDDNDSVSSTKLLDAMHMLTPNMEVFTMEKHTSRGRAELSAPIPYRTMRPNRPGKDIPKITREAKGLTTASLCHSNDETGYLHASCDFRNLCIRRKEKRDWKSINRALARPRRIVTLQQQPPPPYAGDDLMLDFLYITDLQEKPPNFTVGLNEHKELGDLRIVPIAITSARFQKKTANVTFIPGSSILWHEYIGENFGHVLIDNLYAIFSLQDSFGTPDPYSNIFQFEPRAALPFNCAYQFLAFGTTQTRKVARLDKLQQVNRTCQRFMPTMFPMISHRSPFPLGSLLPDFDTRDVVCFERLLGGMPLLGLGAGQQNSTPHTHRARQSQLYRFRAFAKHMILPNSTERDNPHPDAGEPPMETRPRQRRQVVIWDRNDSRRKIHGLVEFGQLLEERYRHLAVKVVVTDFESLSLPEQVSLMGNSTVHITGPGGGSYIGLFLPHGASHIRLYSNVYKQDHFLFDYAGYIHVEHVWCEKGRIPQDRVLNLVEQAFHRHDAFSF